MDALKLKVCVEPIRLSFCAGDGVRGMGVVFINQ